MKNRNWFKRFGWIHYPTSWQGWLVFGLLLVFLVLTFRAIDRHSHSVSDTLFGIFPFWVPAFLLTEWIASKTSKQ